MATGNMPNEDQLRTIAAASRDEQAQVWKGTSRRRATTSPGTRSRAPSQTPHPVAAAKFDDDLAHAYGVVWEDDLFAPAGEDGRYTTNVEGFFAAQQEWLPTTCRRTAPCCRATNMAGRNCRRRPSTSTASPPSTTVGHYLDERPAK